MTIFFYKVSDPYGCFSNFSPHSIQLGGCNWPTSEHYYQAQKYVDTPEQRVCEEIRRAQTPEAAVVLGRNPHLRVRPDWDHIKPQIMYQAVLTKFLTHLDIQSILLATGNERIVEESSRDAYWGCGADGQGQNQLGKILMRVRHELRLRQATGTLASPANLSDWGELNPAEGKLE